MSGAPETAATLSRLAELAKKLRATQRHWNAWAAMPEQRARMQAQLDHIDSYLPQLLEAARQISSTREGLAQALASPQRGIQA